MKVIDHYTVYIFLFSIHFISPFGKDAYFLLKAAREGKGSDSLLEREQTADVSAMEMADAFFFHNAEKDNDEDDDAMDISEGNSSKKKEGKEKKPSKKKKVESEEEEDRGSVEGSDVLENSNNEESENESESEESASQSKKGSKKGKKAEKKRKEQFVSEQPAKKLKKK